MRAPEGAAEEAVLELRGVSVGFPSADGGWRTVVDRVSLTVHVGERVGLVGESGSGKSLTGLASLGLVLFVGVGMCLVVTFTLLPALARLFESRIIGGVR